MSRVYSLLCSFCPFSICLFHRIACASYLIPVDLVTRLSSLECIQLMLRWLLSKESPQIYRCFRKSMRDTSISEEASTGEVDKSNVNAPINALSFAW